MGSQVPSTKSQHGGKVPTFESQETIKIWLIIMKVGSWLFYGQIFLGLVLRVGSSFLLVPTLNTSPKPYLQIVLWCRHPCHTWDLEHGTLCEVVSPNFHALNGWDCTYGSQVTWDSCELTLRLPKGGIFTWLITGNSGNRTSLAKELDTQLIYKVYSIGILIWPPYHPSSVRWMSLLLTPWPFQHL